MVDVLVIGGGNAALCAALMAREAGASVLLLEASPREWRGGNSQHTRNLRCMHDEPQDVLLEAYPEEEFWQDLLKVTGGNTDEQLARLVIRASSTCRPWMRKHGVRFQPSLAGTLHLSRTNAFFMGGGKALVNAYYRSAENLGVRRSATTRRSTGWSCATAASWPPTSAASGSRRRACVLACGGFESNREWLREAWGQNERGEWPADNFLIRGTRFNQGVLLKFMMDAGRRHHRRPDAGALRRHRRPRAAVRRRHLHPRRRVSLGVMLNREGLRFYDEGEDFWPKRYAIWGRLVAMQPGQIGYCIIDSKAVGRFMPPVFPGVQAAPAGTGARAGAARRPSCRPWTTTTPPAASAPSTTPCWTTATPKAWRRPRRTGRCRSTRPPFYGYALRPGITFTYLGLKTDETPPCTSAACRAPTCSWPAR
jgi:tricarballylate dehydrogenase